MRIPALVRGLVATVLFSGGLVLSSVSAMQAKDMGTYGGPGGQEFRSPCRSGWALAGISLRSGTAMDSVAALCVRLNGSRTAWVGEPEEPTKLYGGPGGGPLRPACRRDDVVRRLKVNVGPWGDIAVVKHIVIECYSLSDPSYHYPVNQYDPQGTVNGSEWFRCQKGYVGSGIYGGAGNLVDRLGLSCRKL